MGSCISAIYDDHDSYEELCKVLKEDALDIRDSRSFYKHAEELIIQHFDSIDAEFKKSYIYLKFAPWDKKYRQK
jgi:hypothetical protein